MTWSCTQARNVRRDNLDMRRPVWVSAVAAPSAHEVLICVRINLQAPRAIDALDGVEIPRSRRDVGVLKITDSLVGHAGRPRHEVRRAPLL